mgnify:CR=1 FL=1
MKSIFHTAHGAVEQFHAPGGGLQEVRLQHAVRTGNHHATPHTRSVGGEHPNPGSRFARQREGGIGPAQIRPGRQPIETREQSVAQYDGEGRMIDNIPSSGEDLGLYEQLGGKLALPADK